MRASRIHILIIVLITVLSSAVFSFVLYRNVIASRPEPELPMPENIVSSEISSTTISFATPSRLIIPAIGIDTNVQHVGVTEKGNMANPKGFKEVGWYKYGTVPGQQGNAVIGGHFDNGLGRPAVFYDLNKLQVGDDVYIEDADGKRLHFKVRETKTFDYNSTDTQEVFKSSHIAGLNLITCDGAWIKDQKTYDKRIVVFTELQN